MTDLLVQLATTSLLTATAWWWITRDRRHR